MSWQTVALDELCEINVGKTPSRANKNYWSNGTEPWLSIADMTKGFLVTETKERITKEAVVSCNCKIVLPGTVLMSFKLSVGKVSLATFPVYTNEAIAALPIKNKSILCDEYLAYALKNIDLQSGTDRAAMGLTLNKDKLKRVKIPLPPLTEQKRIAAILDKAAEIKAKREQMIAKLDVLAQSTFVEMFGDCQGRKDLVAKQVKDVCEFKYGKPLPEQLRCTGNVNVYGSNGVVGEHDSAITLGETIVIGRKGSYGKINYSEKSCYPIDTTFYIDSTSTDQNLVWLKYALGTLGLDSMNKSAAVPGLSREDAYRQMLYVPTLPQQIKFAKAVEEISKKIALQNLSTSSLNQLISSLQHQAFTTGFAA